MKNNKANNNQRDIVLVILSVIIYILAQLGEF